MGYNDAPREQFEVTCAECGVETTVPFKPDGRRPVTCKDCFAKNRPPRRDFGGGGRRDDRGPRESFDVTCGECGVETTVPFKPTGDRPVLCKDCFSKNRPPRRDNFGGDRGPRDRVEHEVTCAQCGKNTTVPFKPTGSRPVLCRDCFRK